MISYSWRHAVNSQFEPKRLFETLEEAQAFDRGFAVASLHRVTDQDITQALRDGDESLAPLLRFMADELEDAAFRARVEPKSEPDPRSA